LFFQHLTPVHPRQPWAKTTPGDQLDNRGVRALGQQFDPAIRQIPHPSRKPETPRLVLGRGPKEHALHPAGYRHPDATMVANRHGARSISQQQ
jgi:hypothetical protein